MKLPEFKLFSDKSAQFFLIFPNICPNFYGFPAALSHTPMVKGIESLPNKRYNDFFSAGAGYSKLD
jgi:hypothetical protein